MVLGRSKHACSLLLWSVHGSVNADMERQALGPATAGDSQQSRPQKQSLHVDASRTHTRRGSWGGCDTLPNDHSGPLVPPKQSGVGEHRKRARMGGFYKPLPKPPSSNTASQFPSAPTIVIGNYQQPLRSETSSNITSPPKESKVPSVLLGAQLQTNPTKIYRRLSSPELFLQDDQPSNSDPISTVVGNTTLPLSERYAEELAKQQQEKNYHLLKKVTFSKPTWCDICGQFIWGLSKQGYRCTNCHLVSHGGKCCRKAEFLLCRCSSQQSAPNMAR